MNDLTFALRAAADHATADRDPLPAPPVLTRIHRRRTVRYASQGAVGMAAAGAAVVGGVQVAARAPEPSPAATGLAESMTVRCGVDLDAFAQPEGAPDVTLRLDAFEAAMVEPADAQVPFTVDVEAARDAVDQAGTSLTYALVQGATVVGLPEPGWVDDQARDFVDEQPDGTGPFTLNRWSDVRFGACQEDGTVAGTPAPGTYGVVAFLVPDDGSGWPIPFRSNGVVIHLGDPLGPEAGRPDLESLVISTDGLGPVRLGEAPPAAGPGAVVEWQERGCVVLDDDGNAQPYGRWAATYGFRTSPFGADLSPFGLVTDGERVTAIEVVTEGPRTPAGVQVGDSLAQVQSAHPEARLVGRTEPSGALPGRDVWAVVEGDRTLAFQVATDEPGAAFPAEPGTVMAIVVTLGTDVLDGTNGPDSTSGTLALGDGCLITLP